MSDGSASSSIVRLDSERNGVFAGQMDKPWRQVLAGVLAATVFCIDAFTPQAVAVGALYVLALLMAVLGGGRGRRRRIIGWSTACLSLSVIGWVIFEMRGAPPEAVANLAITVTVLLVTTFLLLRGNAMDTAVRLGERRYRNIFDTLATAIWEHDFALVAGEVKRLRASGVADLRRYLDENPQFVVEMRRLVRITDVNATALKMMGVGGKEAFFSHLSDFLPETDESFADCIIAIDERRPLFQAETSVLTRCGERRQIIVAFGLGPDACLDKVPGSIVDVSDRRALEAQITRTRADLAEAQRSGALAAMSASIAHELHQPLSAIQSYADAARRWMGRTSPNLHEVTAALTGLTQAVGEARTVTHRVRSLVGNAPIEFTDISLDDLLCSTVALLEGDAVEAGTRIVVEDETDEPCVVRGDRVLLKQVFVNLITNAIEAMEGVPAARRVVTVEIERFADEVVVQVKDRGVGWEGSVESKVFGSFYTTKPNGMGLGLSISRTTVERHGGSIALRPGNGGGAVVEVALPLAPVQATPGRRFDRSLQEVSVERLLQ